MFRRSLTAVVVGAAAWFLLAARPQTTTDPAFAQIDTIVRSLSAITGLAENHPVPYGRMTKRQLRQFLNKRIKKTIKPEEIRADELSLKMFGLVPQDFDLKKSTIDLLTEQAAAFYDYDEKKLFLLEDSSLAAETTTLAHELSHALADQHFDLDNFMEDTPANDDENLAHTAVVEGQASWLMIAYELKEKGQTPAPSLEMLKSVGGSSEDSLEDYPVLKAAPLYIQQSLLFPYSEGTLFFDAVYRKVGKSSFSSVFTDAPVDSAQIIHPERYFRHQKAAAPEIPKPVLKNEGKEISEGFVGEFDHRMLLRQYLGSAKALELAPHLRGGQFRVVAGEKAHKPVLEYASEWDSEEQAANFFAAYRKILQGKWTRCDIAIDTPLAFAGTGDNGYFVTRLKGGIVSSVEGLSDPIDWKHLKPTGRTLTALRRTPR
jgi:hypothetical protein